MIPAADLIAAARSLVDTPFHHQGRQPGVGVDCGGLIVLACRSVGIDCEDPVAYGRRPHNGMMEALLDRQACLERIPKGSMRPADLLLMRFATDPQHLALYTGEGIIHAYETVGRAVEHRLDHRWAARIARVYRFREVEAG